MSRKLTRSTQYLIAISTTSHNSDCTKKSIYFDDPYTSSTIPTPKVTFQLPQYLDISTILSNITTLFSESILHSEETSLGGYILCQGLRRHGMNKLCSYVKEILCCCCWTVAGGCMEESYHVIAIKIEKQIAEERCVVVVDNPYWNDSRLTELFTAKVVGPLQQEFRKFGRYPSSSLTVSERQQYPQPEQIQEYEGTWMNPAVRVNAPTQLEIHVQKKVMGLCLKGEKEGKIKERFEMALGMIQREVYGYKQSVEIVEQRYRINQGIVKSIYNKRNQGHKVDYGGYSSDKFESSESADANASTSIEVNTTASFLPPLRHYLANPYKITYSIIKYSEALLIAVYYAHTQHLAYHLHNSPDNSSQPPLQASPYYSLLSTASYKYLTMYTFYLALCLHEMSSVLSAYKHNTDYQCLRFNSQCEMLNQHYTDKYCFDYLYLKPKYRLLNMPQPYNSAISQLRLLVHCSSLRQMLRAMQRTYNCIKTDCLVSHGGKLYIVSMDDLLPVMIFVVLRACIVDFPLYVKLVDDYIQIKGVFELEERIITTFFVAVEDINRRWRGRCNG